MKSVYIEVYGCTANKSDAKLVSGILSENNFEIVNCFDDADIVVVLTCTVIDTTEQKMLSKIKKYNSSGKKIVISGCMASIQHDIIQNVCPGCIIIPIQNINQILKYLSKTEEADNKLKSSYNQIFNDVFAPILISEGCMFECSYCITTHARGKLVSFPMNDIVKNIKSAINQGCKEIQLTAQDTASYGFDLNINLGELLKKLGKIDGDNFRIRIGMMNPYMVMKYLGEIISGFNSDLIYKFIHIPVQSGNNDVLNNMNRKYTVYDFKKIVNSFRDKYPNICLATDVIVGFPGETEEQFNDTINLLEEIKPDITNITRFSARPYTKAKKLKDRIPTEVVKNRSKRITNICSNISKSVNEKHVGRKYNVLVTEKGKNNTMVGRSENYKPVVISENVEIGSIYSTEIIKAHSSFLIGRLI